MRAYGRIVRIITDRGCAMARELSQWLIEFVDGHPIYVSLPARLPANFPKRFHPS
jgi:hypothetical protein